MRVVVRKGANGFHVVRLTGEVLAERFWTAEAAAKHASVVEGEKYEPQAYLNEYGLHNGDIGLEDIPGLFRL